MSDYLGGPQAGSHGPWSNPHPRNHQACFLLEVAPAQVLCGCLSNQGLPQLHYQLHQTGWEVLLMSSLGC